MPRNICLAFGRFGSLFLLTSSVSADGVVCLVILSGCCSSSSLAIPVASTVVGRSRRQSPSSTHRSPCRLLKLTRLGGRRTATEDPYRLVRHLARLALWTPASTPTADH